LVKVLTHQEVTEQLLHLIVLILLAAVEPATREDRGEEQAALEMLEAIHHLKEIREDRQWADHSAAAEAAADRAVPVKTAEVLLQGLEDQELLTTSQVLHILMLQVE
jgi:hypothetical protein